MTERWITGANKMFHAFYISVLHFNVPIKHNTGLANKATWILWKREKSCLSGIRLDGTSSITHWDIATDSTNNAFPIVL